MQHFGRPASGIMPPRCLMDTKKARKFFVKVYCSLEEFFSHPVAEVEGQCARHRF
jgi:hypothetical protein